MESSSRICLTVTEGGLRLDKYLADNCNELTRSHIKKLIDECLVTVNGKPSKSSFKVRDGDKIIAELPPPLDMIPAPENIPLQIVYEDVDLLVIDKPAGITVHPAPGHPRHTLVNAIVAYCPEIASIDSSMRPGIIHRLDKDTSGLMIVAKNNAAQMNLFSQFKSRSVLKQYLVLVKGRLLPQQGSIQLPIGRDTHNRKRMAVTPDGRASSTLYQVITHIADTTLLIATLETGRTHQIRVHFSSHGYPVVGDTVYGGRCSFLSRQFLHSHRLGFTLPHNQQFVEFESPLPEDLQQALEHVRGVLQRAPA